MELHPRAGQPAQPSDCIDVAYLVEQYYNRQPVTDDLQQAVRFGTSGHRGSAATGSFNQTHLLAIAQAIAEVRACKGITGYCFIGKDTHALSEPAFISVVEVLTANGVPVVIQADNGFTPTPAISHAILCQNQLNKALADGIIITPSHNPPQDGGIKYNLPNGGPAGDDVTTAIQQRANALITNGLMGVKRRSIAQAEQQGLIERRDLLQPYVADLHNIIDMQIIQSAGLKLGVDPLGGAGVAYWQRIAEVYQLDLTLVNPTIDPTFSFMSLDSDGIIRMDCASPHTMTPLLAQRAQFDLCLASDTDHDRHGIVTPTGLMAANHYLTVAVDYLLRYRPQWPRQSAIGTTVVSSIMVERAARHLDHPIVEMPVGFKGFVEGLYQGSLSFAGEESAGASFLRFNGRPWSTDKDGIILCLLAAEITAVTGQDPQKCYQHLHHQLGPCSYNRLQRPLTAAQKRSLLAGLSTKVELASLAGDAITGYLTTVPGSGTAIGGLKVMSDRGWFAIRPSGTEALCKIHCESLVDIPHRQRIEQEALGVVEMLLRR